MKKIFCLLILILQISSAEIYGNLYVDNEYGFEIRAAGGWNIDKNQNKKIVVISSPDKMSEVAVDIVPFEAEMKNARDVAISQIEAYDGWEYIAGRAMAWNEKQGGDSAYSCMYNKNIFTRGEGQKLIIVQEYYFVKGNRALVLTLATDNNRWWTVKKDLIDIKNSFAIK